MNIRFLALAFVATLAAHPTGAYAQDTLIFATSNAEQHPLNKAFFTPWAERINAAANGAVRVDVRHGPMLANHTNFYDRVIDDVTQIGWGMTVFNPGRFPRTLVSTLPFIVDSSEQGAVALCQMYEDGVFDEEFNDIVPLIFVQFPQASLHMNKSPAEKLADISGKKIITASPPVSGIVQAYGGAPLSFNITEQYEALQRGAADGTILNFTAFPGFRLGEVTTESLVAPLGGAMGMIFMSKAKWDGLSEAARTAIQSQSGCDATRELGKFVDTWEAESQAMVSDDGKHKITLADPADVAALKEKMGPGIEAGFAAYVEGGADLIARYKAALAGAIN